MLKAKIKQYGKVLRILIGLIVGIPFVLFLGLIFINVYYGRLVYTQEDVPAERVAVVFGARIYASGRLSAMLQDRVETAVQLYKAGKVQKLLFSGDNRFEDYDEPGQMMAYAIRRGVPASDIQPDYAGRRTYDTCYRAKAVFGLESAVLVTQDFHLPRALFICDSLGLKAVGVAADLRPYNARSITWSKIREVPAMLLAVIDVIRGEPAPILGEPVLIE